MAPGIMDFVDISSNRVLVVVGLVVLVALLNEWLHPFRFAARLGHSILSATIHVYLCWRYPIKDEGGTSPLPTCQYSWPSGQGNVGKFLDGIENSETWRKEHGALYRLWSGMKSEVVLTRPQHIKAVFYDSNKHTKAVNNNSGHLMGELLGDCVGLISGLPWSTTRAVVEVPFQHSKSEHSVSMVRRHVEAHMLELESGQSMRNGVLHPTNDFKMLPFWIVAEVFYGSLPPHLEAWLKQLVPIREDLFKEVIRGGFHRFNISRFFPTSTGKKLASFKKSWQDFNQAAYQHACSAKSQAPIVAMYDAVMQGVITREQMLQTIDESLFANLDVTIGGMSWNLVFLAANSRCQFTLREEAVKNASNSDTYVLSSSTYLASCVLESSRLKPLAAFSVPQSAPTARSIDGWMIPAGTDFIVDTYALNIKNPFWGENAQEYDPERFLRYKGTQLRYNYWRFGFGPRQCMGKYIADLVIRVLLEYLVTHYRLSMKNGDTKWARDAESWITHPDMLIDCVKN